MFGAPKHQMTSNIVSWNCSSTLGQTNVTLVCGFHSVAGGPVRWPNGDLYLGYEQTGRGRSAERRDADRINTNPNPIPVSLLSIRAFDTFGNMAFGTPATHRVNMAEKESHDVTLPVSKLAPPLASHLARAGLLPSSSWAFCLSS